MKARPTFLTRLRRLVDVGDLARSYRLTFNLSRASQMVLTDLCEFCRGREAPCVPGDAMMTGVLIGRQEVWHRIRNFLDLTDEQLVAMLAGRQLVPPETHSQHEQ